LRLDFGRPPLPSRRFTQSFERIVSPKATFARMKIQTILGSGGAIGRPLALALATHTDRIRLVSRSAQAIAHNEEFFQADLTDAEAVHRAVAGSDVVYLTVGYPYSARVWAEQWPVTMRAVLAACEAHKAKLVFFDNVYLYDRDYIWNMTETTPIRPTSRKGAIRTEVAGLLTQAVADGKVEALIARSADFYGPQCPNSMLVQTVIHNLRAGKAASWVGQLDCAHSFTYSLDAARAMADLGNSPDAYGQTWHVPTQNEPITGRDWASRIAAEMGVKAQVSALPEWAAGLLGIFVPILREVKEMAYQFDRPYHFDSAKFTKRFGWAATSVQEAIRETVKGN
jgi:nucleoside-diphosphate-sugar epimerase